ncbi:ceeh-2 [Scenedesmus sp. PABB004]|nr:ceeh-2 [Scenedesmus sp. PABB004]
MGRPKRRAEEAEPAEPAAAAPAARRPRRGAGAAAAEQAAAEAPQAAGRGRGRARGAAAAEPEQQQAQPPRRRAAAGARGRRQQQQEQQLVQEEDADMQEEEEEQQQQAGGALDDFRQEDPDLAAAVEALSAAAADPLAFLQPNPGVAQATRAAAKALLAYTATRSAAARAQAAAQAGEGQAGEEEQEPGEQQQQQQPGGAEPPPELHVGEGFDSEQVWLQLDLQLAPLRRRLRRLVGQLEAGGRGAASIVSPEVEAGIAAVLGDAPSGSDGGGGSDDGGDERADGSGSGDEEGGDEEGGPRGTARPAAKKAKLLPVEDRFFKLDEMEAFVAQAEREAAAGSDDNDGDGDDDADLPSDGDGDGARRGGGGAGSELGSDGDGDAELANLLAASAAAVGRPAPRAVPASGRRRRGGGGAAGSESEEEEEDDGVDPASIMYADFFGAEPGLPKPKAKAAAAAGGGGGGGSSDEDGLEGALGRAGSGSDADSDGDADMGEPSGSGDGWDDAGDGGDGDSGGFDDEDDEMGIAGLFRRAAEAAEAAEAAAGGGGGRAGGAGRRKAVRWEDGGASDGSDGDDDGRGEQEQLSTHERRLQRIQERIAELEAAAMSDKPWQLSGEAGAAGRPLNSALELDLEYENTQRPPPAPTEESTQGLEDIIRRRIAEARWDDVVRVVPPPVEKKKRTLEELDDTKASQRRRARRAAAAPQGLGELYESEYVAKVSGAAAPDKAEPLRRQAAALFKALCAKLDALSSFAYTPKPVVEELEVRSDVAALSMEEVAPLAVSDAAMRTPGEVFAAEAKGEARAEGELTREDRRRRRAKKKRAHKAKEAGRAADAAARAAAEGRPAPLVGRKSLSAQLAAATSAGLVKKGVAAAGPKADYGKSTAVFGKLAEAAAAGAAGAKEGKAKKKGGGGKGGGEGGARSAAALKLAGRGGSSARLAGSTRRAMSAEALEAVTEVVERHTPPQLLARKAAELAALRPRGRAALWLCRLLAVPVVASWAVQVALQYVWRPWALLRCDAGAFKLTPPFPLAEEFIEVNGVRFSWRHQMAFFKDDYDCVALDMRGYARSDKPEGIDSYRLDVLVEDVRAAVGALGHSRCTLVAHDWGGLIAWAVAGMHGSTLLDALVVAGHPHYGVALTNYTPLQYLRQTYVLLFQARGLAELFLTADNGAVLVPAFLGGPPAGLVNRGATTEPDVAWFRAALCAPGGARAMLNYYRALLELVTVGDADGPTWRALKRTIEVPVLVLHGERDHALGEELLDGTEAAAPKASVRVLKRCSHWVQQDYPHQVSAIMAEWLREQQAPAAR